VEKLSWVWGDSAWHDLKAKDYFALNPPIHKLIFSCIFDIGLTSSIKGATMFKIINVSVLQGICHQERLDLLLNGQPNTKMSC